MLHTCIDQYQRNRIDVVDINITETYMSQNVRSTSTTTAESHDRMNERETIIFLCLNARNRKYDTSHSSRGWKIVEDQDQITGISLHEASQYEYN